ncbi:MAG: hypothetical protein ACREEM_10015 [Blastocatellia bacterium]
MRQVATLSIMCLALLGAGCFGQDQRLTEAELAVSAHKDILSSLEENRQLDLKDIDRILAPDQQFLSRHKEQLPVSLAMAQSRLTDARKVWDRFREYNNSFFRPDLTEQYIIYKIKRKRL